MGLFSEKPRIAVDDQIHGELSDFIREATEELVIVSPYVEHNGNMLNALLEKAGRTPVELITRKDKEAEYRRQGWFAQMSEAGISIHVVDRLHSKIYANDTHVIVGSANFTAGSWAESRELMFILDRFTEAAEQVMDYVNTLRKRSVRVTVPKQKAERGRTPGGDGFCIHCRTAIRFSRDRPYCRACWQSWNKDSTAAEHHCHRCGQAHRASQDKPICPPCFKRQGLGA